MTLTKKVHDAVAPPELSVVHVTEVLTPRLNELPEAGEQEVDVIGSGPPTTTLYVVVADAVPLTGVMSLLEGQAIVGGVELVTPIVN